MLLGILLLELFLFSNKFDELLLALLDDLEHSVQLGELTFDVYVFLLPEVTTGCQHLR